MSQHPPPSNRPPAARRVLTTLGSVLSAIFLVVTPGLSQESAPAGRGAADRPIAVWPPGPLEVVASFERPISEAAASALVGRTIVYDDIDPSRPGSPLASEPAGHLRIVAARRLDDGRTLRLATDPHPRQARYHLPILADGPTPAAKDDRLPTIAYDLSGAEAAWTEGDNPAADPAWKAWWPSLDLDATRPLTRGSHLHEAAEPSLARPGRLVVSGWVRLPAGKATVRIQSTGPIEEALVGDAQAAAQAAGPDGLYHAELVAETRGDPVFLSLTVQTGTPGKAFSLRAAYRVAGATADHPIGRDRLLLPWVPQSSGFATPAPLAVPDLSGGDPARGRTIFRGDQARCAQCHAFRGEGGQVGPDLTEIARKGRADIYRSIAAPSAVIAPDYTTYTVATRDGQVLSGVVRADGPDQIRVVDTNAKATTARRDHIQEIRPSATSIMPPGLAAALGDGALRDLIAYLTSPAPPAPSARP